MQHREQEDRERPGHRGQGQGGEQGSQGVPGAPPEPLSQGHKGPELGREGQNKRKDSRGHSL